MIWVRTVTSSWAPSPRLGLPHRVALTDPAERARRQDRLQRAEATLEAMPFDVAAART
jgi:hypothetical protein